MLVSVLYLLLGLLTGVLSGVIGIGGGVFLVPALLYLFGLSQHQAQGTTLAILIPPIGLLAVYTYYKAGHVNLVIAALVALGFFIGGYLGAKYAVRLPDDDLRKIFGVTILLIALYMIFKK